MEREVSADDAIGVLFSRWPAHGTDHPAYKAWDEALCALADDLGIPRPYRERTRGFCMKALEDGVDPRLILTIFALTIGAHSPSASTQNHQPPTFNPTR